MLLYICVLILVYVSSCCLCSSLASYAIRSASKSVYMCPHTIYVSSSIGVLMFCIYVSSSMYVSSCCLCSSLASYGMRSASKLAYLCLYVSSYCYVRVLILLYMCPHTSTYVSSYYYMCPHTTIYVFSTPPAASLSLRRCATFTTSCTTRFTTVFSDYPRCFSLAS